MCAHVHVSGEFEIHVLASTWIAFEVNAGEHDTADNVEHMENTVRRTWNTS